MKLEAEVRKTGQIAPEGLGVLASDHATDLNFGYGAPLEGHANALES